MFDHAEPAELIDAMGSAARAESAAIAQRLEAVAVLFGCRERHYTDAGFHHTDVHEAVAAEVSAAQNISRSRSRNQVDLAVSLYTRLPKVAEAFARGDVDFRMVQMVLTRTQNVEDDVIGALDEAVAPKLSRWMRLSKKKLRDRVDLYVADFDPAAVRVPPVAKDNRYFDVTPDVPGMAFAGGLLNARDAAALDQRLEAIAATVVEQRFGHAISHQIECATACLPRGKGLAAHFSLDRDGVAGKMDGHPFCLVRRCFSSYETCCRSGVCVRGGRVWDFVVPVNVSDLRRRAKTPEGNS